MTGCDMEATFTLTMTDELDDSCSSMSMVLALGSA